MVGKGQPPKKPEDKRKAVMIYMSENEKKIVEAAKKIEKSEKQTGAYIRDMVISCCKKIIGK